MDIQYSAGCRKVFINKKSRAKEENGNPTVDAVAKAAKEKAVKNKEQREAISKAGKGREEAGIAKNLMKTGKK